MRLDQLDALVLAGGRSARMGTPKAALPWGATTVIGTTIATLQPLFRRVLVVAREEYDLAPQVRDMDVRLLHDARPERGPLVGLAVGLAASDTPWCFVAGCDMPLLRPEVIARMARELDSGGDIVAARVGSRIQPLHAFYSAGCLSRAEALLESGVTSLRGLFSICHVRTVAGEIFADIDPALLSFMDLDTVKDYRMARRLTQKTSEQVAT
ncbi:MAG: molybdenum cofactor guanylyltransferase [Chloroflexi bacterium]|nr:molybdenum cofactor guanylyltransferase [Chloroflexota bacterium]